MTPYQFIQKFNQVCARHKLNAQNVWHYCDMEEHQTLIDEHPGEWEDFEQCLKLWAKRDMQWDRRHEIPLPDINCKSCRWFDNRICHWHKKAIPEAFDLSKACKHWNEDK